MFTADRDDNLSIDLIRRARTGENAALAGLIETWRTYLLHIANEELDQDLKDKVAASDVVQSACLDIHNHFADFRGVTISEWKSWLRQLLLRDVQDARRRFRDTAKRNVQRERRLIDSNGFQFDTHDEDLSPRAALIAEEELEVLRAALLQLSDEHRNVIRLRNWDELSFAEIGQRLNRSEDAARKLWSRAIDRLQSELKWNAGETESS